ncbi:MAG: nitrate reductase [Anaerolineaceae bacterium]|nr:nitrate reductase [Anaerolineaceae bacterium]
MENLLAEAFCYPTQGQLTFLKQGLEILPASQQKEFIASFVKKISRLSTGEWEELYTRTLDLNPPAAPYIGFQTWGESYQRGAFLAQMNRVLAENEIDLQGELPDHVIPVLRYLGKVGQPLPELVEVLEPAIQHIITGLQKADSGNPYLDLLKAVQSLCNRLEKEQA